MGHFTLGATARFKAFPARGGTFAERCPIGAVLSPVLCRYRAKRLASVAQEPAKPNARQIA